MSEPLTAITAWSVNGGFHERPVPPGFNEALEAAWNDHPGGPPHSEYGNTDFGPEVTVWTLGSPFGRVVAFGNGNGPSIPVWVQEEAAYLDLMTTRVPIWCALPMDQKPVGELLQEIRNTLIGFARHGQGDHVSEWGAENRIDADRKAREREAAKLAEG